MAITFPFNFQPYSTSIKTGSYTVPAGYYALVTGIEAINGSITLNGSMLYRPTACYAEYVNTGSVNSDVNLLTIPDGFYGEFNVHKFSSSAHTLVLVNQSGNGNAYGVLASGTTVQVRGGDIIRASYNGAGSSSVYFGGRSNSYQINNSIWCKSGDALAVTSAGKYMVVEYPMVT